MALDIIIHNDEDTNEETEWGVLYEDGSVKWYASLEEAQHHFSSQNKPTEKKEEN